jgi:hypothetical protein
MAPNIVSLEVVDYGVCGEYGIFGKVVCKSNVEGKTAEEVKAEKAELRAIFGYGVNILEVEEIPALRK